MDTRGRSPADERRVPPVAVVGAAIVDDLAAPSRVLVARRTEPPALAGRWEVPGGKVDPGESWEEALHRELREELGVAVSLGSRLPGPLEDGRWRLSPRHVIAVWAAQITEGEPAPLEDHDELRWVGPREAARLEWVDGDRPIAALLVRLLGRSAAASARGGWSGRGPGG